MFLCQCWSLIMCTCRAVYMYDAEPELLERAMPMDLELEGESIY